MELSQEEKQLIRSSYSKISDLKLEAGRLFYGRLFQLDPGLREMFHRAPIETQAMKLMQVFDWIVERLDRVEELQEELDRLGAQHIEYGVKTEHYALVGSALIWTLKQALGPEFDGPSEAAWIELYTYLSGQMEADESIV